jgi:hypothetical protein
MTKLSLIPKTVILAENDYQNFIHQISGSRAITPDISTLRDCAFVDKASDVAREMFASVVDLIKSAIRSTDRNSYRRYTREPKFACRRQRLLGRGNGSRSRIERVHSIKGQD